MNRPVNVGTAARIGTYSDAVEMNEPRRILVTSGTPGLDPATGRPPADFAQQAELAWKAVEAMLAEAGMTVADIVKLTQYLVRREDLDAYRPIRARHLGDARPASMLLFVPELVWPDMLFELEVIAAR